MPKKDEKRTALETAVANAGKIDVWKPYSSAESQAGYYIMLGLVAIAEQLGELAKAIALKSK